MLSLSNVSLGSKLKNVSLTLENQSLCVISDSKVAVNALADVICGIKPVTSGEISQVGKTPLLAKGAPMPDFLTVNEYFDTASALSGISDLPPFVRENSKALGDRRISSLKRYARMAAGVFSVIIPEGEFFFCEYPTSALTPDESAKLLSIMLSSGHSSRPIFSSDSLTDAKKADLILALYKGEQIFFGAPSELDSSLTAPATDERLKKLVSSLERKDLKKKEEYEIAQAENAPPKKIDISLTAFNRELDDNPYDDDDEDGQSTLFSDRKD